MQIYASFEELNTYWRDREREVGVPDTFETVRKKGKNITKLKSQKGFLELFPTYFSVFVFSFFLTPLYFFSLLIGCEVDLQYVFAEFTGK